MALTLMYITNRVDIAQIAQAAGVDRIWVDMEYIGKDIRQAGMDTVKSHHTIEDILKLRPVVTTAELLVRVNPIHDASEEYCSSEEEIEQTIAAGADVIMLPMFKTKADVERFLGCVNHRAKTLLLLETAEAVENLEDILTLDGIDEVHIGLNDLHLAYHKTFMFELLADGTVEKICKMLGKCGFKYGFGGIARVGYGELPAEIIMGEHYRLGSTMAILSRGFCNANNTRNVDDIRDVFQQGVQGIRKKESELMCSSEDQLEKNRVILAEKVRKIVESKLTE